MNIPPFIRRTPPPIDDDEEDDCDDFGSFVHDDENGGSDINTPIERGLSSINNILHSNSNDENISGKINKINSHPIENSINEKKETAKDFELNDFQLPLNVDASFEELEFVAYNNGDPEFKCDFNCDSGVINDSISESVCIDNVNDDEIKQSDIQENTKSHDIVSLNDSIQNANETSSICTGYELDSECDTSEIADKPFSTTDLSSTNEEVGRTVECSSENNVTVCNKDIHIDKNDGNDFDGDSDDFDDFADFQSSSVPEPVATTSSYKEPTVDLFENAWPQDVPCEDVDLSQYFDTEIITDNRIWQKLQYLEDTPALKYTWPASTSNHKMLSALKIDSRNILCGPWSKAHRSLASEGRNFEGLVPCEFGKPSCSAELVSKASVPEAHFDWEGSGLTNPLFVATKEENFLEYDLNNLLIKRISSEAEEILQNLPNLSFIKKPYIVFNRSAN
ncbi:uncharacterized protein LOC106664117 isoform X2 [Cimex lectularius]|uniref:Aftiphilin clathrin-binding box domain-containing protein n=1 Tax=Cimex lectularius TaxID=79782 RepID=A0A8I6TCY2_CIMLE|nr:uncharacterized protein LOC106664117 isoform X2 [Cimex lectularius]